MREISRSQILLCQQHRSSRTTEPGIPCHGPQYQHQIKTGQGQPFHGTGPPSVAPSVVAAQVTSSVFLQFQFVLRSAEHRCTKPARLNRPNRTIWRLIDYSHTYCQDKTLRKESWSRIAEADSRILIASSFNYLFNSAAKGGNGRWDMRQAGKEANLAQTPKLTTGNRIAKTNNIMLSDSITSHQPSRCSFLIEFMKKADSPLCCRCKVDFVLI